MARDAGLEEILSDDLRDRRGMTSKAMFGGWGWLLEGNLLCASRHDGMLFRLGKGNDGWALAIPGIEPMLSRGKVMHGWVRSIRALPATMRSGNGSSMQRGIT